MGQREVARLPSHDHDGIAWSFILATMARWNSKLPCRRSIPTARAANVHMQLWLKCFIPRHVLWASSVFAGRADAK